MNHLFKPYNSDELTWRWRRRLPHWEQPGCTYFVTFRSADSLPQALVRLLEVERITWLTEHPPPWDRKLRREYARKFSQRLEQWLDDGFGSCDLAKPRLSQIVEDALRFHDGVRYLLDEYVIMPNHVHCLILPSHAVELSKILKGWKSYSSRQINGVKVTKGRFWMEEGYDRIVRDVEELERYRTYIRENPHRASLERTQRFRMGRGLGIKC